MILTIERSPARVSWHVKCAGQTIDTQPTKKLATEEAERLSRKLGISIKYGSTKS